MAEEMPTLPGLRSELEPGEPVFVLRARDPLAPHLAALWAALRKGDTASAIVLFADTVADPAYNYRSNLECSLSTNTQIKVSSASAKAQEMNAWREANNLEAFGLHTV